MGVAQNERFTSENPIKKNDPGIPLFGGNPVEEGGLGIPLF